MSDPANQSGEIPANSMAETKALAESFAKSVLLHQSQGDLATTGLFCFLEGTLGAGKTTWAKHLIQALGVNEEVVSPTFTLSVPYQGLVGVLHVDAYRLQEAEQAQDLGIQEALEQGDLVLVEWAEKIESQFRREDVKIFIQISGESSRTFRFVPASDLGERIVRSLFEIWEFSK